MNNQPKKQISRTEILRELIQIRHQISDLRTVNDKLKIPLKPTQLGETVDISTTRIIYNLNRLIETI